MGKHREWFYAFLKLSDNTWDRRWTTPSESREVASALARMTKHDVLVYRMTGAVRVRYDYVVSKSI